MIESLRADQRRDLGSFGDGLADLFAGRPTLGAEASARSLAEAILLHRKWIYDQYEKE